jgi:hypothetical protein
LACFKWHFRNGERRQRLISKKVNNSKFLKCHLKQAKAKLPKTQEGQVPASETITEIKIEECDLVHAEPKEQAEAEEQKDCLESPVKAGKASSKRSDNGSTASEDNTSCVEGGTQSESAAPTEDIQS